MDRLTYLSPIETQVALEDLGLERLFVVFPGEQRFPLSPEIEAVGLSTLGELGL